MASKRYTEHGSIEPKPKKYWEIRAEAEKERKRRKNLERKLQSEERRFGGRNDGGGGEMGVVEEAQMPETRVCMSCGQSSALVRPTRLQGLETRVGPLNTNLCPECRQKVDCGQLDPRALFPTYRIMKRGKVKAVPTDGFRKDWIDKRDNLQVQLARVALPSSQLVAEETPRSVILGKLRGN